jgi:F-type H+-transporting ATPase subunit b
VCALIGRGLSTGCFLAVFAVSAWALAAEGTPGAAAESPPPAADAQGAEAHSGGGHQDRTDLTTANQAPLLEDPSEWRYDMALCTLAVFLCLFALLTKFAWKPIMVGLEQRERSIRERIDEANLASEQAAEVLKAHAAKLQAAAGEAQQVIAQAERQAEVLADKIRAAAAEDAARERQRALADIRLAKHAALREVAQRGADMAVSLAGRIVRRELQPSEHAMLITQALEQFPSSN